RAAGVTGQHAPDVEPKAESRKPKAESRNRILARAPRGALPSQGSAPGRGTARLSWRPMRKPTKFGKYLLLDRIAVGGMAEVFVAKAFGVEGFERLLAIKKILPTMG